MVVVDFEVVQEVVVDADVVNDVVVDFEVAQVVVNVVVISVNLVVPYAVLYVVVVD